MPRDDVGSSIDEGSDWLSIDGTTLISELGSKLDSSADGRAEGMERTVDKGKLKAVLNPSSDTTELGICRTLELGSSRLSVSIDNGSAEPEEDNNPLCGADMIFELIGSREENSEFSEVGIAITELITADKDAEALNTSVSGVVTRTSVFDGKIEASVIETSLGKFEIEGSAEEACEPGIEIDVGSTEGTETDRDSRPPVGRAVDNAGKIDETPITSEVGNDTLSSEVSVGRVGIDSEGDRPRFALNDRDAERIKDSDSARLKDDGKMFGNVSVVNSLARREVPDMKPPAGGNPDDSRIDVSGNCSLMELESNSVADEGSIDVISERIPRLTLGAAVVSTKFVLGISSEEIAKDDKTDPVGKAKELKVSWIDGSAVVGRPLGMSKTEDTTGEARLSEAGISVLNDRGRLRLLRISRLDNAASLERENDSVGKTLNDIGTDVIKLLAPPRMEEGSSETPTETEASMLEIASDKDATSEGNSHVETPRLKDKEMTSLGIGTEAVNAMLEISLVGISVLGSAKVGEERASTLR